MKKIAVWFWGIVIILTLSACAAESTGTAESIEFSESIESSGSIDVWMEESAEQEETIIEEETVIEEIVLAVEFDEEFKMELGDNFYVGNEDTRLFLKELEYMNGLDCTCITYELMIGETVYEGMGEWSEENGERITQDVYAKNRVRFIGADKGESVTLMITSGAEVQAPLLLSKNAEDEYVTEKQEYIESDEFILFLDAGMTINGNIEEQIKTIIDLVEKEWGFKLINDSRFSLDRESDISWLYGDGAFDGVDPNMEKFHIYAVPDGGCAPFYSSYSIVVNQMDLNIAGGDGMVFVHELTHAVQLTNGVDMGTTMNEGIATYIAGQICDRDEIIPFNFVADQLYIFENRTVKVTSENAEEEFLQDYGDDWDNYLYGYNFITFLCETYGEDIYRDIFIEATKRAGDKSVMYSGTILTELIKEKTSGTVFADFVKWIERK